MIEIDEIIDFETNERETFRSGQLREEWTQQYPRLFDEDDLRIARDQQDYHFYEWLAAVYLFKKNGYLSLVEQYQFPSHKRKRDILAKLLSPSLMEFIERGPTQAPDPLVYTPDFTEWGFCEVKGPNDSVSETQKDYFSKLAATSGKKVHILKVRHKI